MFFDIQIMVSPECTSLHETGTKVQEENRMTTQDSTIETANDTKKTELVSINIDTYTSWTGNRVDRSFKFTKLGLKLDGRFPVPSNDEQAQTLYGVDLATIIALGVKQVTYSRDGLIKKLVEENGITAETEDTTYIAQLIQEEIQTPPAPKTAKKKVDKAEYDEFIQWKLRKKAENGGDNA